MTSPPSFVAMLLIPWPPLRTEKERPEDRTIPRASTTSSVDRGRSTEPGWPVRA
jgi:hypothetical protein